MRRVRMALVLFVGLAVNPAVFAEQVNLKDYYRKSGESKTAYGIYLNGKKIGWQLDRSEVGKFEGKDVRIKTHKELVEMRSRGAIYRTETSERTVHSLEGDGTMLFFEKTVLQNGKPTSTVARLEGNSLVITTKADGQSRRRTVPPTKDTLRQDVKSNNWLAAKRKPGDRFESFGFSDSDPNGDLKLVTVFEKSTRMMIDGVSTPVNILSVINGESKVQVTTTAGGEALQIAIGTMLFKREPEDVAKQLNVTAIDEDFEILVKKDLGSGRLIDRLTLEITGLQRSDFPTSHRQRILEEKNGVLTVEVCRDFRDDMARRPLSDKERRLALESNAKIQADHETIRKLANEIVGAEKDPTKKATLLMEWVHRNLKKTYAISANTSLRVLQNKAGKCTDHALLFVALARAADLPARELMGLAFVPVPNRPNFAWHAWAEIHDGNHWVSVDPMWGEIDVDATHIRLSKDGRAPAFTRKMALTIKRFESSGTLLEMIGLSGVSNIAITRQNLKLLDRAIERKLLTDKEAETEIGRIAQIVDLNLVQMQRVERTAMSHADRRTLRQFIDVYKSLKVQVESLKTYSKDRNKDSKTKYEQAVTEVQKRMQAVGKI